MGSNDSDRDSRNNWQLWRFVDGALAISVSMLLAALLRDCLPCGGWPVLGYLHGLAARDDGVIIVGTMLLFPTTAAIYGGIKVFFAAREAVRRESREKGRQEERERIRKELAKQGVAISPELAKILNGNNK